MTFTFQPTQLDLEMEKVLCKNHGAVCMLKTGVKEGPNKGKSFYVCVDKQGCDFSQAASLPPSNCLQHEESTVELRALTYSQQQKTYRLFYRCVDGKKSGLKWCGNVPWAAPNKEKCPLTESQPQLPCVAPVRNPFKAPGRLNNSDSVWRKIQSGAEDKTKTGISEAKENEEETLSSHRDRVLPPGMKLKKKEDKAPSAGPPSHKVPSAGPPSHKVPSAGPPSHKVPSAGPPSHKAPSAGPPSHKAPSAEPSESRDKSDQTKKQDEEKSEQQREAEKSTGPSGEAKEKSPDQDKAAPESRGPSAPEAPEGSTKAELSVEGRQDDEDDEVVLVSVQPPPLRPPSQSAVQKSLTTFPGFQKVSNLRSPGDDPQGLRNLLSSQLQQKKATLGAVNLNALPDKGARLKTQVKELEEALDALSLSAPSAEPEPKASVRDGASASASVNPFSRPGGTLLLPAPPPPPPHTTGMGLSGLQLSQVPSHVFGGQSQDHAFYGGRMTEDRLLAVKNATCEAIDHLHTSLESCPPADTEAPDPKGLKVTLLAHQKRALAWLLWREEHNPCGGILADDMGLGKTLTMISLLLSKKMKEEDQKPEEWLSKKDSSLVQSRATLIVCPASLVHHWKKEIERHVRAGRLSVYLYHGSNREKSAKLLADHDVVVTTYGLVSKEIPPPKDGAEKPSEDSGTTVTPRSTPLLRVTWARIVLDEAHNIKNPKVQTSMAVCELRARARWAVTGTPIQNNLLDLYSLLKFLRCAPFDEYKLWKAQVDNGSKRGRERLNVLTRALLLRRTKDQLDSSGKPLVSLPERTSELHKLRLSEDEQAVYDVLFAQSRSTLQNYLKRHEGQDVGKGSPSTSNPFDKVAQEFGMSQSNHVLPSSQSSQSTPVSSTVHILSLLLRLRQCCCHLSLLRKTLDSTELHGDGIILSLEEQLNALSLSSSHSSSGPDPEESVSLNGTPFHPRLFEETRHSTKISAIMSELKVIRQRGPDHKSVIVSQWTSMLKIVAVHLQHMGLSYSVIDGSVQPKKRMDLVEDFNTQSHGAQVMLVSLCAGGVGLNLIGGNHLFLIDMHWNPALEDQACDRIYRVGQRKDVTIHRFVCEDTVEEKISTLQAKKKELAQNVLSGTGKTLTKLSLADLRLIFGV